MLIKKENWFHYPVTGRTYKTLTCLILTLSYVVSSESVHGVHTIAN